MSLRSRSSAALRALLLPLTIAACQPPPSSESTAPANELVGVWSLVAVDPGDGSPVIDPSQPGIYIFAEDHYSAVFTPGPEPRIKAAMSFQPTQDEMAVQYASIIVNAGTYQVSGSTVTFRPLIAKSPAFVGGHQMSTFRVSGDTLELTQDMIVGVDGASPPNVGGSLTLVRLE